MTEAFLTRHYQGVRNGRDAALLDIAQDHALYHFHREGLFERGLVFKGGTALRKYRAGQTGRFSTDLDFSAPDEELWVMVEATSPLLQSKFFMLGQAIISAMKASVF
ncbi:MAG: nucleotidyl transferase AbiEii/AbiGii toxin family protein [Propionibacteriaceae bacterium]|nr:nucleotidyl transferase AbiEii/AbiGii toxin family protein [Propionibacteriaceae bacterium]